MDRNRAVASASALGLASMMACSSFHWSGYAKGAPAPAAAPPAPYDLAVSTHPAPPRPREPLVQDAAAGRQGSLYYSDLGPDEVDVSGYPAQQRYNYAVYAKTCARCHRLARSINAPTVSRNYWTFYMLGMRGASWLEKSPRFTKAERTAILDFLDYDSHIRKVSRREDFDKLTKELKTRFDRVIDERLRKLSEGDQPLILREAP